MSDLLAFGRLGFAHIVSRDAMDHLLFLLALAAVYRLRDWPALVWAVSAFTVGHSVTLALAVMGVLSLPAALIEFLIPVTIVATALVNIAAVRSGSTASAPGPRILLIAAFGLIHGAGFANYLRGLFIDSIAVPLLGFNLGIEIGQLLVVAAIWVGMTAVDRGVERAVTRARVWTAYRVRVAAVSLVVAVVSSAWAVSRVPW